MLRQKPLVVRITADLVEKRMTDERRVAAVPAKPRLLERQSAQDVVHKSPHLLDPPASPSPNLRRRVVKHRNAVGFCAARDPPVEAWIIDQHHGVRPVVAKIPIRPAGQVQELVQIQQHAGKPHHRQSGQVGMELAADLRHLRAAVADRPNAGTTALQLPNQVGPVQIAARLADREKDRWRFGFRHHRHFSGAGVTIRNTTGWGTSPLFAPPAAFSRAGGSICPSRGTMRHHSPSAQNGRESIASFPN